MFYKFKRKEDISESVCRIAGKCLSKALKHVKRTELESIHNVRKEIKRVRALLRLVRHAVGSKLLEEMINMLRKASHSLAAPRDAYVKAEALERLLGKKRRAGISERFVATRTELRRECSEAAAHFRQQKLDKEVRDFLRKICFRTSKLHFRCESWEAIAPVLRKTYQKTQKARDCAMTQPTPENFHALRKCVKDLLCFIQLLEPIWPEQMGALAGDLDALAEWLGEHHDLHMLRQTVIRKSVDPDLEPETAELLGLIDARQKDLRNKALKFVNRLFEEKASEFCRRLHEYWKNWKSKRTNLVSKKRTEKRILRRKPGRGQSLSRLENHRCASAGFASLDPSSATRSTSSSSSLGTERARRSWP